VNNIPAPLLRIANVSKSYGETQAVNNVSLDIASNEFFALLGPSGCGKTTLLRAIAGFESIDSGTIELDGSDLLIVPANRRPVNLMFQSYALFPHLDVYDNIAYGLRREKLPKAEIAQRVDEVLETVGMSNLAKRRPVQLSGGQRQRVALARAIVKRPRLLLLDEPLSALDRKVRAEMQIELKRLQHEVGITFVVVTHDQEEAMSMADRIAVMNHGEVAQIASPQDLYLRPESVFVADFIGTSNLMRGSVRNGAVVAANGVVLASSTGGQVEGTSVTCSIRPEQIHVADSGQISGTVISTHFYGGDSLVVVDCGFETGIKAHQSGMTGYHIGDTCSLSWDTSAALVLTHE
jgi:spermidine/putrescine transport system ATP-binding protein/putrescine transport system ATP-binding protein